MKRTILVIPFTIAIFAVSAAAQDQQGPSESVEKKTGTVVTAEAKEKIVRAGREAGKLRGGNLARTPFSPKVIDLRNGPPSVLARRTGTQRTGFQPTLRSIRTLKADAGNGHQLTMNNIHQRPGPVATKAQKARDSRRQHQPTRLPRQQASQTIVAATPSPSSVQIVGQDSGPLPAVQIVAKEAPPLDEWEAYVAGVSQKYEFTDAQDGRAQTILVHLKGRAQQYRMSRVAEYETAESLQDADARTARLATLNQPINELFAELKMRLENLPTIPQKLAAQPAPSAK